MRVMKSKGDKIQKQTKRWNEQMVEGGWMHTMSGWRWNWNEWSRRRRRRRRRRRSDYRFHASGGQIRYVSPLLNSQPMRVVISLHWALLGIVPLMFKNAFSFAGQLASRVANSSSASATTHPSRKNLSSCGRLRRNAKDSIRCLVRVRDWSCGIVGIDMGITTRGAGITGYTRSHRLRMIHRRSRGMLASAV